jgi:hypothetical protein
MVTREGVRKRNRLERYRVKKETRARKKYFRKKTGDSSHRRIVNRDTDCTG